MEFDVFLSHNNKDKPAVRELKALLEVNAAPGSDLIAQLFIDIDLTRNLIFSR